MKSQALVDMYAILTAGGRNSGEVSRALPQRAYRDPAETVQFEQEKRLKSVKKMKKYRTQGR